MTSSARLRTPRDNRNLSRNYTIDLGLLGLPAQTGHARLLDVGCGAGRHELAMADVPVAAVACDLSRRELRDGRFFVGRAHAGCDPAGMVEWVQAEGSRLPFGDRAFDSLICAETLEHVEDDVGLLRELRRVAKPGARLAVSVPAYWPEAALWLLSWRVTHVEGGHLRIYREGDLDAKLDAAGWLPYARRRRHAFETVYWLLGAVTGGTDPPRWPARMWRELVTSPGKADSTGLAWLERRADPILPKSVVIYAQAT